jgi:RHS repeat-associated protein
MKLSFRLFVLALLICLLPLASNGQMGNDNPTSVTGEFSGSITTGGYYDPYTGNAKRMIDDIVVPGSIGAYPLKWTRILNTRSGWTNSYNWGLWFRAPQPPHGGEEQYDGPLGGVSYPDGRHIDLWDQGEQLLYDAEGPRGMFNKIMDRGGGYYDLLLGDGGKVVFYISPANAATTGLALAQAIVDPYGQTTTLDRNASGKLTRVTEPGGRYLQMNYTTFSYVWNAQTIYVDLLTSVQAFDGRGNLIETVSYGYTQVWASGVCHYNLTHVYYDNGTQAVYTYELSNLHNSPNPADSATPDVVHSCDDMRYAGPMKQIEYEYVQWGEADPGYVAWGQIKSERNFNTHQIVSQATHPTSSYGPTINQRTETRGDGATRLLSYGLPGVLDHYTDFKNQTTYLYPFTDARGNTTTIEYEPALRAVKKITHPVTFSGENSTLEYTFSDPNNPYYRAGQKDENGNWTYFDRDPVNHRVTQIRYPDQSTEQFTYNNFGQVLTHKLRSDGTETFIYDTRGLKTTSYPPATNSDPNPWNHPTQYYYYTSGPNTDRLYMVIDPRGNATAYEYNQCGQVTKVQHQDGTFTQSGYYPDGTLAWTADENHPNAGIAGHENERTRYTYDEYKRVLTVTNPMNQTTTTSYALDWANPLLHTTNSIKYVISPMNKNVVFDYDANFRKIDQVVALGTTDEAWTLFEYDEVGNLTKTTDPRTYATHFGYDARNRKIWMDDPIASDRNSSGHTMNWEYDAVGNKRKETRADNAFRSWDYDSMNRLAHAIDWRMNVSDPAITTTYTRDILDRTEHVIDAKGADYKTEFDEFHRKTSETYPPDAYGVARTETWHYDVAGNMNEYHNPAGQKKYLSYDERNRARHSWWDGAVGPDVVTNFDWASRMTDITTNNGETVVAFGYDNANRKIWEDQTLLGYPTHRVETPSDEDGNRASIYVAGLYNLMYQYSQRSQLVHILDGNSNPFYDFSYDASGNETQRQNRVWYTSVSNFQYDELNRVTLAEQGSSSGIFAWSHYQYDSLSREAATWRDENTGLGTQRGERFAYTTNNQLASALYNANNVWLGGTPANWMRSVDYGYTADTLNRASVNDNGIMITYSPSAMNQYQSFNGTTYNYDYNFNLREAPNWGGAFDGQSQLMVAAHGGSVAYFTYDGLGRCVRRVVNPPGGGSSAMIYVYDGWNPIVEFDAAGNFRGANYYGAKADEILLRWDTVCGGTIYKQDAHGNVVALLDQWSNIVERYAYDAFGQPTITDWYSNNLHLNAGSEPQSWYGNRFMFTGREYLPELAIYDYRHRMYQPELGRFLQSDPMGPQTEGAKLTPEQKALYGAGAPEAFGTSEMNLYRYCGDDPVDRADPTGLNALFLVGGNRDNPDYFTKIAQTWAEKYKNSHDGQNADVVQVRTKEDVNNALKEHKNLDRVDYVGHSSAQKLYLSDTGILYRHEISGLLKDNVKSGASIMLSGCRTADGPGSIAQAFANRFGQTVIGVQGGLSFGIPGINKFTDATNSIPRSEGTLTGIPYVFVKPSE